jgi:FkbM family methyltransferase
VRIPPLTEVHRTTVELLQEGNLNVHFSQWGEDVILWHYFRTKRNGFYVDIGAHHPYYLSNTALLHHYNGWRGINVEPDERLIEYFITSRPNDVNLCCGVGAEVGVATMAVFNDGSVNSFDKASVELQIAVGEKKLVAWREVQIRTLADIFAEHVPDGQPIDVLNIDVEGWDLIALQSNDWQKYKPEIILIEDHKMYLHKLSENEIFLLLTGLNYRLVSQTLATSVYKHQI